MTDLRHKPYAIVTIARYVLLTGAIGLFCSPSQAADAVKASPKPALTVTTVLPQPDDYHALRATMKDNDWITPKKADAPDTA